MNDNKLNENPEFNKENAGSLGTENESAIKKLSDEELEAVSGGIGPWGPGGVPGGRRDPSKVRPVSKDTHNRFFL